MHFIAETLPVGIFRATMDGKLLYRNQMFDEVLGGLSDDRIPVDRMTTRDGTPITAALAEQYAESGEAELDIRLDTDDGFRMIRMRMRSYVNDEGWIEVVGSAEDITTQFEQNERLQEEAFTDPVTGTPNRRALSTTLDRLVSGEWSSFAVFLCDLDGFKQVNDSLGHEVGDAVITEVGQRLQAACRQNDFLARLGGDEFVLIGRDIDNYEQAMEFAERLLPALRKPFAVDGGLIELSGSVGVAVATSDSTPLGVLQMADHAMYEAKRAGKNQARPYQAPDSTVSMSPLTLRRDLRRAMSENSLDLAFQPIWALDGGPTTPVAAEALLRWTHPTQGYIAPTTVIPVAEQSGLIRELGEWILDKAVGSAAAVNAERPVDDPIAICVNLSALQLGRADFVDSVVAALDCHGLPADCLTFELGESHLVDQVEHARASLERLHDLGVRLAIDNFGRGHSSFQHLFSLPVYAVKIDHRFSHRLDEPRAFAMLKGLAAACKELDMAMIIEGVDSAKILEAAVDVGATHAQGFHLGKPVSLDGLVNDQAADDFAA